MPRKKRDGFATRKRGFEACDGVIQMDDETLHKLQKYLFSILKDLIGVCNKYSLTYTLGGGSALGAVRHQGFIPWDDDIDVNMPRWDFEKFKKVFDRELGDKYDLCTPEYGKGHGMAVSQVKRKNTIFRSYNELSKKDSGICIDIFVMENTYDFDFTRILHGWECLAKGYLLSARKSWEDYPYLKPYLDQNETLRENFKWKLRLGKLFRHVSLDTMGQCTIRCYSRCRNNHSKYVSIPSGRHHYFKEMYLRKDMCETTDAVFDGVSVKIPKNYQMYLTRLYGSNYMQIPKEGNRERHPFMELNFGDEKNEQ